ncbi:MAG: hypothetical protein JXA07_11775 [Spirochaetes bacterium]|nr:hypothetical protein [Spirochaetota bacterium]
MLKPRVFLIAMMTLIAGMTYTHVYPCDVIVVSAKASTTGRPFIIKNRDCSANWHQEIKHYPAAGTGIGGDYIIVSAFDDAAEFNNGDPINPSGGVNEAGFAISCTSVYEDFNPLHEIININTDLMKHALEDCATLADFEKLLKNFYKTHYGKVISGNFVAIDSKGGAALYECFTGWIIAGAWPMDYRKYDANTGRVTVFNGGLISYSYTEDEGDGEDFIGFHARANCNTYIPFNYGEERRERMNYLLTGLAETGRLNYRNCMVEVAKDVYGQQLDGFGNVVDQEDCQDDYSTTYCISRAATRLSMLVDGVAPGNDPRLSVFWCALGEPSVSVYIPYFVYAGGVSPLAWVDDIDLDGRWYDQNDTSLLARAANARETFEGRLYEANTGDLVAGMDDKTMDKNELANIQSWTFPLEEYIFQRCEEFLADITEHPSYLTPDNLRNFSNYSAQYAYRNYLQADANAYAWTYDKPWDDLWIGYTRGGFDNDYYDPIASGSTASSGDSLVDTLLALFGL